MGQKPFAYANTFSSSQHCVCLLQVPCAVTRNVSSYANMIPVEVAGWMMRRLAVSDTNWVLVLSTDDMCELTAQLVMRAPVWVNVCLGLSMMKNIPGDMLKVESLATNYLIPAIKEANGLPSINWILAVTLLLGYRFSPVPSTMAP